MASPTMTAVYHANPKLRMSASGSAPKKIAAVITAMMIAKIAANVLRITSDLLLSQRRVARGAVLVAYQAF